MAGRSCLFDPLKVFRFHVIVEGSITIGFRDVQGLEDSTEIATYREGGWNTIPQKSDGLSESNNITLIRGTGPQLYFAAWRQQVYNAQNATAFAPDVDSCNYRRTVTVLALNRMGVPIRGWQFLNCWPCRYKPASDFNAMDNTGISVEELELCNEGFIDLLLTGVGGIGAAAGTLGGAIGQVLTGNLGGATSSIFGGSDAPQSGLGQ